MKKIVKPHKARKPSASTDVPSFARGKDQILKSPTRLQRLIINEQGEYDNGKDKTWYDELNNSMLGAGIKFVDPTGISSYYDVYQSAQNMYNNPSWSNAGSLALETFGALPLIGKLGKALKIGKKIIKRGGEPELEKMGQWIIDQGYPRMIGITKDGVDAQEYDKGKDDHKYFDYIIAQSMLGNPTAKRMTGEDNRYIPAFGQGDRSNIVLGSYGNYATPSVMNVGGELMYTPNPWAVFPEWMVQNQSFRFNNPNDAIDFAESYKYSSPAFPEFFGVDNSVNYDEGKDSGIHIKKKNRGKFTAAAKRAGMGVQAYARKILSAPKGKYSPTLRRRAAFAKAASKFKH